MKNAYMSSGFFAFLGVVLLAVCVGLCLNMPAQHMLTATTSQISNETYIPDEPTDTPVIDARLESKDSPTNSPDRAS